MRPFPPTTRGNRATMNPATAAPAPSINRAGRSDSSPCSHFSPFSPSHRSAAQITTPEPRAPRKSPYSDAATPHGSPLKHHRRTILRQDGHVAQCSFPSVSSFFLYSSSPWMPLVISLQLSLKNITFLVRVDLDPAQLISTLFI